MPKKEKLPPIKAKCLAMRSVNVQQSTADATVRSVRVVTATENPVERWDESRGMVVAEVLEMDGMQLRPGAKQIPIVDSHDTSTVRNVLGSLRELNITGDEFGGTAYFASDDESQRAYKKLVEGHITDFSITAQPNEIMELRAGQSYTTSRGTEVIGPANVITNWTPLDASLVATGADSRSTVRRSYLDVDKRRRTVDESLLAQLKGMGLPDGMEDPNQVLAWVVGKLGGEVEEPAEMVESMEEEKPVEEVVEQMIDDTTERMEDDEKKIEATARKAIEGKIKRALASDQKRRNEIQATCKLAKVERAFADQLCDAGVSVEEAKQRIIEKMATQPLGRSVEGDSVRVTQSADDKYMAAARDGLLMRAKQSSRVQRTLHGDKPAPGAEDFSRMSLLRMAEKFMQRSGVNTDRYSAPDIARAAIGDPKALARMNIQRSDPAYHTTGSFANLLLDAANKTLLAGYEEAPYTWNLWARQATSVDDFKAINRIRFSESPDLEHVPENTEYPEGKMTDSRESYKVEKFGKMFSVTWETVVNDDLDAISRTPAMHGNAARRTQNKKVYEVLTSNPTMSDSFPLFSSSHASGDNTQGAGAPAVGSLNTAFVKMMLQKGLNTDTTINVIPRYLIAPVALSATVLELFNSISYNAANNNEGVRNIYGPGGERPLAPIIEPVLDGASSSAWYLAADPGQIDTVELSFLSGEESPVLESEWDFTKDCYLYKIRQTFGVKAIDWRGLLRAGI